MIRPVQKFIVDFTSKYSSFDAARRILAWVLRFKKNASKENHLTTEELKVSENKILLAFQEAFLGDTKSISKKSPLLSLDPFTDGSGLLRVGGRLKLAPIPENQKHPIIIPKGTHLAKILARQIHADCLHGGPALTLACVRTKYWIMGGKRLTKDIVKNCIRCAKIKATASGQLMGQLPEARLTPSGPFSKCGIDYAGPVTVKFSPGRGTKTTKGYIAIFICMVTKAIHLEAVSDLTAEAFLAALKRFIGRRGLPTDIYSDNGTNFVKGNKILKEELTCELRRTKGLDSYKRNSMAFYSTLQHSHGRLIHLRSLPSPQLRAEIHKFFVIAARQLKERYFSTFSGTAAFQ